MPLSWNEIKSRAVQFSKEWAAEKREDAEAQSFWNDFFNVFGVARRTVASFEEKVRNLKGQFGFIDLFWRGKLLAEHKNLSYYQKQVNNFPKVMRAKLKCSIAK